VTDEACQLICHLNCQLISQPIHVIRRETVLHIAVAGVLCLPLTYWPTRQGSFAISIATIVAVAILSAWLSLWYVTRTNRSSVWWVFPLAFALGAIASEALFFACYYFDYGHSDQKLSVGVAVSIVEGAIIALLGGLTVLCALFAIRRITSTSRATR
jgi:hypothetical protein